MLKIIIKENSGKNKITIKLSNSCLTDIFIVFLLWRDILVFECDIYNFLSFS